jgi:hypothetical protein
MHSLVILLFDGNESSSDKAEKPDGDPETPYLCSRIIEVERVYSVLKIVDTLLVRVTAITIQALSIPMQDREIQLYPLFRKVVNCSLSLYEGKNETK